MEIRHASLVVLFACVVHLAGCDRAPSNKPPTPPIANAPANIASVGTPTEVATPYGPNLAVPSGTASATPPPPAPAPVPLPSPPSSPGILPQTNPGHAPAIVQDRSPQVVLAGWAHGVEARDWATVRAYWGENGSMSGLSPAAFAARWGRLRAPRVTFGPGDAEGAAGSLFYTAPVTITDGARKIAGDVVLRRVNDVDGATSEQLRWHIESSTLRP